MPRRDVIALLLLVALAATGCSSVTKRLSFIKQDPNIKGYTRIAPEYTVRERSAAERGQLAAADQVALGSAALQRGQPGLAVEYANAALKLEPRNADAYTLLAVAADTQGNAGQAGAWFAKAVELAPQSGAALNNHGAWLCSNGRAAESLPLFARAAASPGYARPQDAWANAGACALKAGRIAEAASPLQAALQREPGNVVALEGMAELAWRGGDAAQARDWIDQRLAVAAASPTSLQLASQISTTLGDKAAAARYLQRLRTEFPQAALRVDPKP